MLYGLFLEVPLKDLKNSFKNVKFTSASLIINFIWTPLLGYFLGVLFLKGNIDSIGEILHNGWLHKKQMADGISNASIDTIYDAAMACGATGGKISGAGGGGFMIFYAPYIHKYKLIETLNTLGGKVMPYSLTNIGLTSWTI